MRAGVDTVGINGYQTVLHSRPALKELQGVVNDSTVEKRFYHGE